MAICGIIVGSRFQEALRQHCTDAAYDSLTCRKGYQAFRLSTSVSTTTS